MNKVEKRTSFKYAHLTHL